MKGIIVTNGQDYSHASPLDFVMDSRLKGGMKINNKLILKPTDYTFDSAAGAYYGSISHGLGYVPATICFQGGFRGQGWQNSAGVNFPSVNADGVNIYFQCGQNTPLTIIIFGEKVADA